VAAVVVGIIMATASVVDVVTITSTVTVVAVDTVIRELRVNSAF
jgi:hypothetical protein